MMISIVSHFYNNQLSLDRFVKVYERVIEIAPDKYELVLVDDHSIDYVDIDKFKNIPNLRVYRVEKNIPWNQGGSRNIGVLESRGDKVLICDIDHVLKCPEMSVKLAVEAEEMVRGTRMFFPRDVLKKDGDIGSTIPHLNSFLMFKTDYWKIGGYEELFSGAYGDEDKYFQWCARKLGFKEFNSTLKLEVLEVGKTQGLNRDKTRNRALIQYLMSKNEYRSQNKFLIEHKCILDTSVK